MLRHDVPVRQDLDRIAYDHGFDFHIIDNEIYWDESRAYRFTLRQVEEQIEKPTAELHQMCLGVVERAVNDEQVMQQLANAYRVGLDLDRESAVAADQVMVVATRSARAVQALALLLQRVRLALLSEVGECPVHGCQADG